MTATGKNCNKSGSYSYDSGEIAGVECGVRIVLWKRCCRRRCLF